MADELDVQEPEVQKPQEIPEDATFAPRNVAEAMAMPDLEPSPVAPEPEPVSEESYIGPDWLNEPVAPPPELPPQPYPQPVPDYYPQPAPAQPQTQSEAALNTFVEDPYGVIDQRIAAMSQQQFGQLAMQQQTANQMMSILMENTISDGVSRADQTVKRAYDIFNQDPAFKSNKEVQNQLGSTLRGMRQQAELAARAGNFQPLNSLASLSDADMAAALAFVKAKSGVASPGVAPLVVEGAAVETARPAVAKQDVQLSPEQQEIARRMGGNYEQRLKDALAETEKLGDLEYSE
jgi:hypothetical protein